MIQFRDYKCTGCGHEVKDIPYDTSKDNNVKCPICETKMEQILGGLSLKVPSRTERPYPIHLLNGGDRAVFRK